MESFIIGYLLQYLLAGVGIWQLVTGSLLYGAIILLIVVASDIIIQKNTVESN